MSRPNFNQFETRANTQNSLHTRQMNPISTSATIVENLEPAHTKQIKVYRYFQEWATKILVATGIGVYLDTLFAISCLQNDRILVWYMGNAKALT